MSQIKQLFRQKQKRERFEACPGWSLRKHRKSEIEEIKHVLFSKSVFHAEHVSLLISTVNTKGKPTKTWIIWDSFK